jgi:enkurin
MSCQESIYRLIPEPEQAIVKKPLHRSKYARKAVAQTKPKSSGAMFGPKNNAKPNPKKFLKKTTGAILPEPQKFEYGGRRKPPVDTRPVAQQSSRKPKNFVKDNATKVALMEAKRTAPDVKYSQKQDFGAVPAYLDQVKAEIQAEKDYVQSLMETEQEKQRKASPVQVLPEEERIEILASLKKRWQDVNREYQKMTHIVNLDTPSLLRKKENFESELTQLEEGIEKFSKKVVLVKDDE